VLSLPLIDVKSNPLGFLPSGDATARDYAEVGRRLTGFYTMEVVVEPPAPWWDPAVSSRLDDLGRTIAASPIVARVVSPLDLLRQLNRWRHGRDPGAYSLPRSAAEAEALLGSLDERGRDQLAGLATASGRTVRLSAVVDEMDEHDFLRLVEDTRAALGRLPPGWGSLVTGQVLQLVNAQERLVQSQLRSFGLAALTVFLAIWVGLRSWRLMLVSIMPNVLPLGAAFALMAATRIPLDPATVMVASIALGLAVDNTVHQLEVFHGHRAAGATVRDAVNATRAEITPAIVTTGLTACAGFFALCLSAFPPIRFFGLLSGTALSVELTADLLVVPAQLVAGKRELT
jgi:predicted RND superfamily exporter protein